MDNDIIPVAGPLLSGWMDILIVLGAIALVALIVFFWAFSRHKNGERQRKHHDHRKGDREQFQKSAGDIKEIVGQHRSGRRRKHRTINPTLAETGGLPPLREAGKPAPSAPRS